MFRSWLYAVLLSLAFGIAGCSQDSTHEKQEIERLTGDNAELVRVNQKLRATNEALLQLARQGIDLVKQKIAEEQIKQEQRALDAVVKYWCTWGPVSLCPAALIRNDVDMTLAPSHPYFYPGAFLMLLLLGTVVGGISVGALAVRKYFLRPTAQKIESAKKIIDDSRAAQAEINEQRKVLDSELQELADLQRSKAALDRELEGKQTLLETLKMRELNETPRIDAKLAKYGMERKAEIDASLQAERDRVQQLVLETNNLEQRRARLQKELDDLLELEKQAAIRREHFGALFRPQKYREQQEARHDSDNASDATQNSKDSAK